MESFNQYLQKFPHYTPAVYQSACSYLSEKTLKPGDFFIQSGKICKNVAFIEEGLLRQYYLNDGKEVTNCFCKEGTMTTSYRSLITQQESDITVQAIETSRLVVLSYDSLQKLFNQDLFWQQVGRIAAENEFITTESHARFLQDFSATDRYLHVLKHENDLLQRVPLVHLATYLQITPETLSRIRSRISQT